MTRAHDQPAVVLLPGLDGTGTLFLPLLDVVEADLQVVSYNDAPTQYEALVPWLIERLPVGEPFAIVAESFSGPAGALLAAKSPAGLSALVLVNSFVRGPRLRLLRWLPWRRLLRTRQPDAALRKFLLGPEASPASCEALRRVVAEVDPAVMATRVREVFRVEFLRALGSIAVPILDLRGRQDRLVPPRTAAALARANPRLVTRAIDGPHLLLQERPAEAWGEIRAFLATC